MHGSNGLGVKYMLNIYHFLQVIPLKKFTVSNAIGEMAANISKYF
jgi:hypothetical protein